MTQVTIELYFEGVLVELELSQERLKPEDIEEAIRRMLKRPGWSTEPATASKDWRAQAGLPPPSPPFPPPSRTGNVLQCPWHGMTLRESDKRAGQLFCPKKGTGDHFNAKGYCQYAWSK